MMMLLCKNISIPHWKLNWPGEKEQHKGPARVSRLVSQKNRGSEPPSSPPPYQSHEPLPFYPFCSLPWTLEEGRDHPHSRSDQTELMFYWSQVHKVISILQFSGLTWDAQEHQDPVGVPTGQFWTSEKWKECISQRPAALHSRTRQKMNC